MFDTVTNTVVGVRRDTKGSNYVNPKAIVVDGDGVDLSFNVVVRDGEIFSITVDNPGRGYTYTPVIEIVEGDVNAYIDSNTIGVPQSISITRNGGAFHLDKTVASTFSSKYVVSLKNFSGNFQKGEIVTQKIGTTEVARARVAEWRFGSNLLKLEGITGIVRENVEITGHISRASGTVRAIYVSTFVENITAFFDNIGYYKSDRGKLGVSNQKLVDSHFYQDYSYVVKSKTPIDQWRDLIKSTTHPAGFKLFGQVDVETNAAAEMPAELPQASHFSVIQLWDPNKNKITVENTTRVVTQTVQKVENQRIRRGVGSAATSEFNFNESRAFTFTLAAPFDGYYDTNGVLQGTKTFQVLDDNGLPFTPSSAKNLIITLDGVLQEPEVAYTISGDSITFSQPPLGPNQKLTGSNLSETTSYAGVTFYGRYFNFKDNQYNTRYFKKLKNIFQRNGRWIDSANQIERNRDFIIEESVGYGKEFYPALDWSTKLDDYQRDIGYILDAYEHDIRFGGNVKTVDYVSIFGQDTNYDYITKNKTESLNIFKYATNLAKLAIRNWDIVETGVNYITGSTRMTVSDTNRLAVGMHVSSGRSYPEGTKIISIDSNTQITLSNAALANSGGGGGAPDGTTNLDGSTGGTDLILNTNTGVVLPGDQFAVDPGDTLQAPISFSGSDDATFFFSGINNGTFYDASNLIAANKAYLQEEVSGYTYATYTLPAGDEEKCKRDLGYLIDAVVYHLRLGGNEKVVEFARLYYTNAGYPDGERLTYINRTTEETNAAIDAWNKLAEKMILAMRNSLGAGTYTNITPVTDPSIAPDSVNPPCVEVASAINSMIDAVKDILANGTGAVDSTPINASKPGYWTSRTPYTDYNLIPDTALPNGECDDVISSVDSLYDNVDDVLNSQLVAKTLPDYVDGENKVFEMYWEDGSEVNTEEDEDLFLSLNAVLQRPKYNADYPGEDAYYIDRTTIPNKLVFDVAPIWDQDFGAKSIGEPTAVEKVVGIGVGNYKRLTIDYDLVNGTRTGPFLILDVEDNTVQSIEDKEYLYVFLDGVLQREGYSYEVAGPNIYFNVPIKKEMKIDMRYLYGRDVGQILNIYDFAPDTYFATGTLNIETTSTNITNYLSYKWMGNLSGFGIHCWQQKPDGTYNVIGKVTNPYVSGNNLKLDIVRAQNSDIIDGLDLVFAVEGRYSRTFTILDSDITSATLTLNTDDEGRKILSSQDAFWYGTILRRSYKNPFVSLSNGDQIRVDGEEGFRKIKVLPSLTTSKDGRGGEQLSDDIFGSVSIESYNGVTRGEGLSVIANIENGKVVSLTWNQRSFDPLTQPTAYQYFTPPVLEFVPQDGTGGGARAEVIVSKGQVISVDLLDGGSGYTKAPRVIVARRYQILTERDIGVSLINVGINPFVESAGMTATSTIDVLGNQVEGVNSFTSIFFNSPIDTDRVITAEIQLVRESGDELQKGASEFVGTRDQDPNDVQVIDVFYNATVVSAEIQGVLSSNSITNVSRTITTSFENLIPNDAISNVNFFEVGAYLDVDLDPTDTIVYIPDTAKFKTNGYLLIGNEVVRYLRKANDRFLFVERGENNTTPQFWAAGTFLRQIPDPVSIAFGGVIAVESDAAVVSIALETQITRESTIPRQSSAQITADHNTTTEFVITPPPGGAVDGYEESLFLVDPVPVRGNNTTGGHDGNIDLVDVNGQYFVTLRDTTEQLIVNELFGAVQQYIGQYAKTNAGPTIGNFDQILNSGTANVSGITLLEINFHYPALTIRDFIERAESSYTLAGNYFNLANSSIQNPVAISSSIGTIGSSIVVQDTTYFPNSGYLFTSGGTVIQYTSKTATTFDGCTLTRGPNSITGGDQIIPFSIT